MLKQNLNQSKSCTSRTLMSPAFHRPDLLSFGAAFSVGMKNLIPARKSKRGLRVHRRASTGLKAIFMSPKKTAAATVQADVTVLQTVGGVLSHLGLDRGIDDITDFLGKTLLVELVAANSDPSKCVCARAQISEVFFNSRSHHIFCFSLQYMLS